MVAEGYGQQSDWAAAVNQQVVLNGNFKYLTDLKNHVNLTPAIITEVAERYSSRSLWFFIRLLISYFEFDFSYIMIS